MVHLYDKYGEGGGMLSKKAFAQVINVPPCSLHTAVGCFLICYCVTFLSSHAAATACSPPAVGRTSYAAFEEVGPRIFALRIDGCYRYGRDSGGLEEKGNVMSRLRRVVFRSYALSR